MALGIAVLGCAAADAGAQPPADAEPPSQAVRTDAPVPYPALAVALDPVGVAFGTYGVHFEAAPHGAHGIWLAPAWVRRARVRGFALEAGYHLWLLGRGLDGLFVGPFGALVLGVPAGEAVAEARIGAEAGYQHVWGPVVLGVGVGATRVWRFASRARGSRVAARIRAVLGWVWT